MKGERRALIPLKIQEDKPIIPGGIRGVWHFFTLVSWWFAFSTMMGPLPSVIWPSQIEEIVGSENKERYNGFVPAFGAAISLFTTPIAGMMSDRSTARIGRRKVFLIAGSIIGVAFFLLCSTAGEYNIWAFVGFTCGLQFGANLAAGPYAGLVPDTVHQLQIGKASGYTGLAAASGYLVGLVSAGLFSRDYSFWRIYSFLGGCFITFALVTIIFFKEPPNHEEHPPLTVKNFFKSFYLDPRRYKAFYWVILTRLLEQMGYYTVLPFLQYFIQDVILVNRPEDANRHEFYSSLFLSIIILASVPANCGFIVRHVKIDGDRFGRKRMVMISMGIMTSAIACLVGTCYFPRWEILLGGGIVFGLGYGSFLAVDWALALDALPEGADAAKDMGIWHMSFVLPQVVAPVIAGQILSYCKKEYSFEIGYSVVFALACVWFTLATCFVIPIQLRVRSEEPNEYK